jgi:translation machinery-associated protein 16
LNAERRPGRPASTREADLKLQKDHEVKEYASGFWVPDLESEDVLATLKDWGGSWVALNTMTFVRIAKDGTRLESSFPPKGQS